MTTAVALDLLERYVFRCCRFCRSSSWMIRLAVRQASNPDPFQFIQAHVITAAVIKTGRARTLVVRHLLRHFQPPAVLQIRGDPGCPERVAADFRFDAGRCGPAPDHSIGVLLIERIARQRSAGAIGGCAEQPPLAIGGDAGGRQVFIQPGGREGACRLFREGAPSRGGPARSNLQRAS